MITNSPSLKIFRTTEEGADACEEYILECLSQDLKSHSRATLAISGGNTPRLLFSGLAQADFDWSHVHVFWVDERCIPPADSRSNYRMTSETLLSGGKIPEGNVHRIKGELPPDAAAAEYVEDIKRFFKLGNNMLPIFDIVHR